LFSIDFRENVYLIAGCSALPAVLCLFLVLDFSTFGVISPFQDVSGWKLQRMGRDFWQSQKGISYSLNVKEIKFTFHRQHQNLIFINNWKE